MRGSDLLTTLRAHRERHGLSQQALATRVGVSRQAILAIEGGRQVPSTSLALQLARSLSCRVDDLFRLPGPEGIRVRLAPRSTVDPRPRGDRVVLGRVAGRWAAHHVGGDATRAADGILVQPPAVDNALVRPLGELSHLELNVLVAGCAPLLGALAQRVGTRFVDARVTWLTASSHRALHLLASGLVHVAGLHVFDARSGEDNISVVRRAFPGQRMLVVNLTRWRQGLVLPIGNPGGIRTGADLLRPGLRLARREAGAGATRLLGQVLSDAGFDGDLAGPLAAGHEEVARLVACGAADAGVAIESVALAAGLSFVGLAEERFDLVVRAALADQTPVSRLLAALDEPAFRAEAAHLPGYDCTLSGQVTTLDAA